MNENRNALEKEKRNMEKKKLRKREEKDLPHLKQGLVMAFLSID